MVDAAADSQLATNTTTQPTTPVTPATTQPNKHWNTPAFQAWIKATQALPAEQRIEAVSKKLMELNPGFDGKVRGWAGHDTPRIENGVVTGLGISTQNVTDISPVRTLSALTGLRFDSGILTDLSPQAGMPLYRLDASLIPLADLAPLAGMQLRDLGLGGSKVSDLAPLRGMPRTSLNCSGTLVSDLAPLYGCTQLKNLNLHAAKQVTPAQVAALQKALPNCKIGWDEEGK